MNKVILMGRLTRDPEIRYSQGESSSAVARYTLAVDRRFKRQGEEQTADFINCVSFGKTAEFAERYLHKGVKVVVCGRIQTGSYTNQSGQKVYTTDVVADNVQLLESRSASQNRSADQSYGNTGSYSSPARSYESVASSSANSPSNSEDFDTGPDLDISSDDLPF